jgi:VIT1/CCC1 family predicted Fe2+/Mn2+ transporter
MWKKRQKSKLEKLKDSHAPENIKIRLKTRNSHNYLSDVVLGGIDGCVTTFAIVAGTIGGGFEPIVALALGLSNLVADGFSMAVSNYQAASSVKAKVKQTRLEEEYHIDTVPDGEREEIRQVFAQKGFSGHILEEIVQTITSDKKIWIDTMLQEEHGLPLEAPSPLKSATVTFVSFCTVGLAPLLPFFMLLKSEGITFLLSCVCTGLSFLLIGLLKGLVLGIPAWKEGFIVMLFGGLAAVMSFVISYWVSNNFPGLL